MSESKTPRTDAVEKNFGEMPGEMRKLELELNEARKKHFYCNDQLTTARQEIAELKRDKDRLDKAEELKREFKCTSDASDWSLILPFIRPEKPSNLSLREALDSAMKGTKG